MRICQARNASNSPTRGYYAQGEFVPGSPAQPYYYGPDQIGSVRRAFASTSNAPAYAYDPYGNALQATAPLTDFGYASTRVSVEEPSTASQADIAPRLMTMVHDELMLQTEAA